MERRKYYLESLRTWAKGKFHLNGEDINDLDLSLLMYKMADSKDAKKWAIELAVGRYLNGEFNEDYINLGLSKDYIESIKYIDNVRKNLDYLKRS